MNSTRTPMARLLLIRHGPSAHPTMPGLLDSAAVEQWRAAYDAAGIAPDATPPVELLAQAARVARVVASDLPRAVASAARLSPEQSVIEERVRAAVEWCEEKRCAVGESATLAVVTHGVMRRLLARRLCKDGWAIHGRRGYAPWSFWELTRVGPSSIDPLAA